MMLLDCTCQAEEPMLALRPRPMQNVIKFLK
jgi:hypothetical protein